jgi:hypothetical protein
MPLLCVIDTKAFAGLVFIGPFCNEIVRAFSLDCDTRHAKEEEEEKNIQHPRGLSYYIALICTLLQFEFKKRIKTTILYCIILNNKTVYFK